MTSLGKRGVVMANRTDKTDVSGLLNLEEMSIIKEDKDGIHYYDLNKILRTYDGSHVHLSIYTKEPLPKKKMR